MRGRAARIVVVGNRHRSHWQALGWSAWRFVGKVRRISGADGVYVVLPPNFSSSDVRVDNNRRTHTIAAAVEAAGVPHVVLLSSIGDQQSDGTGPVLGLR